MNPFETLKAFGGLPKLLKNAEILSLSLRAKLKAIKLVWHIFEIVRFSLAFCYLSAQIFVNPTWNDPPRPPSLKLKWRNPSEEGVDKGNK